jgi:OHCU decarboxylase
VKVAGKLTPDEAGALDEEAFVARFGTTYEHSPWVARGAWRRRPFDGFDSLARAFETTVLEAPVDRRLALVRSHPELAGREADEGALTVESTVEQASAGLNRLSPGELSRLRKLNAAYRTRFEFPLVVAVREHTKASIFAQGEARLESSPEEELGTALGEIFKIARLRLRALVQDTDRGRDTT